MVEVVPAQVGEGGHLVAHRVHPVLGDGVGGHLHDHRPACRRPRTRPGTAGGRGTPGWCGCRRGCRSPRCGRPVAARIEPTSWVTVVLPLVPVTPTISSERSGWPQNDGRHRAMAGRTSPADDPHLGDGQVEEVLAQQRRSPPGTPRRRHGGGRRCAHREHSRTGCRARPPRLSKCDRGHRGGRRVAADVLHDHAVEQVGHHHHVDIRVVRCVVEGCAWVPGPT